MNEKTPQKVVAPRRRLSLWWWLAAVVMVLVVLPILAHFYSTSEYFSPELIISKETTYITEPLTPEGLPDYAAWLNRRLRQGVTPENNAVVLLLKALGPRPGGEILPPGVFRQLGMSPPQEQGEYFLPIWKGLSLHFPGDKESRDRWSDLWRKLAERPWHRREAPLLVELLEDNHRPLVLVRRASLRPRFFMPIMLHPHTRAPFPCIGLWRGFREVVSALSLRAMLHLGHGRVEEAWQDLLTLKRLGRLLEQELFGFSMQLGWAAEKMAADGTMRLLTHAELDKITLQHYLQQWRQLPTVADATESLDWGERFSTLGELISLWQTPTSQVRSLQPYLTGGLPLRDLDINHILRRVNQFYDQAVQVERTRSYLQVKAQFDAWEAEAQQKAEDPWLLVAAFVNRTARSERMAHKVVALLAVWFIFKRDELCARQYHLLVETALALAVYRARCGHYPEKLEELVPELLPQVPVDLFAPGQTLIYRREGEGYVLYSVGRNGVDDRGRPSSLKAQDDLGFRILPRSNQRLPLVAP